MKISKPERGTILIISVLTMGILLLLGYYFLDFTLVDSKISTSQKSGFNAYYLAEAGINEAIWKLKNDNTTSDGDPAWESDFIDQSKNPDSYGHYWTATFQRALGNGTYTTTIQNTAQGRGAITSTAVIPLSPGNNAQRVVKTTVFKSLSYPTDRKGIFTGGSSENVDIDDSQIKIINGDLFSNHHLNIKGDSQVVIQDNPQTTELEGQALAVGNYDKADSATITSQDVCAANECTQKCSGYPPEGSGCPPQSLSVPLVDFDSTSPNSFKSRAQYSQDNGQCQILCNGNACSQNSTKCILTATQFSNALWEVGQGGTLTLNNEITYVTGSIDLKAGRKLVVKGLLATDDNISIGDNYSWTNQGKKQQGNSQLTITRPTSSSPSGLITKRKIDFGSYSAIGEVNVEGLIYANDEISMTSVPQPFNIVGGIIGRKADFNSLRQWLNITVDDNIILYGLGYIIDGVPINPSFSPIINIDHWEETY